MKTRKTLNNSAHHIAMMAVASALAVAATGCFTVHRSPDPEAPLARLDSGKDLRVGLSGFAAQTTSYTPVRTYSTVWHSEPGWYRHGHYHHGGTFPTTYSSTTYIPQVNDDTSYVKRAEDALDSCGFTVTATNLDYIVDVTFSGPETSGSDTFVECMWIFCSLLSADYSGETWSAKLKVRDARTGKVALMETFSEHVSAAVWGPIPIFSPLGAQETSSSNMQRRALTILTDRAMSEATHFLAGLAK